MQTPIPPRVEALRIRGYRSLADVEMTDLPPVTALIGPNGAGKSNVIQFFRLLGEALRSRRMGDFIARRGGADDQLFGGADTTPRIDAEVTLRSDAGRSDYGFSLAYADPDRLVFESERFRFRGGDDAASPTEWRSLGSGHAEPKLVEVAQTRDYSEADRTTASAIVSHLRSCSRFQFHNTSERSYYARSWHTSEGDRVHSHGGNIAAVLYRLEQEDLRRYEWICRNIARVLPGFDTFALEERYDTVMLRWKSKWSDKIFGPHLTSDGALRIFALITLLNLPSEMLPNALLLDEPELGLHPTAVGLIAGMIKSLSHSRQLILATQSPQFLDEFDLDQIYVADQRDGRTELSKYDRQQYEVWLEDGYSAGDLWQMNLIGGRP